MLGSCEELLIDLGNLGGKRNLADNSIAKGRKPNSGAADDLDPGECQRFREKWSRLFLSSGGTDNYQLFELRGILRRALIHGGIEELQVLAIQLANRPSPNIPAGGGHRHFQYVQFYKSRTDMAVVSRPFAFPPDSMLPAELDWKPPRSFRSTLKAPVLFDFPRALAAAILNFIESGQRVVCCRLCGRCMKGRSNQRFCPGGKCRLAWHRHQPCNKEKWRKYMRGKMREYRALEKRRNQINETLSRRKHAKAKKT